MKIRNGFVTNSSSSSFILAFDTQNEFDKFSRECKTYGYKAFLDLIEKQKRCADGIDKNTAHELLENYYRYEKAGENDVLVKYVANYKDLPWYEAFEKVHSDPAFQEEIRSRLAATDLDEQKRRLDESEIVVNGRIWDNESGLLEWAIRNGFIKSQFSKYCILSWNMG